MVDEPSSENVRAALSAYTERTNRPPVPGVCECYTDWTGIRLVLRRPCPVHGIESKTRADAEVGAHGYWCELDEDHAGPCRSAAEESRARITAKPTPTASRSWWRRILEG